MLEHVERTRVQNSDRHGRRQHAGACHGGAVFTNTATQDALECNVAVHDASEGGEVDEEFDNVEVVGKKGERTQEELRSKKAGGDVHTHCSKLRFSDIDLIKGECAGAVGLPVSQIEDARCVNEEIKQVVWVGPEGERAADRDGHTHRRYSITTVVEEFAERGRGSGTTGLLPIDCIEGLVNEQANGADDEDVRRHIVAVGLLGVRDDGNRGDYVDDESNDRDEVGRNPQRHQRHYPIPKRLSY